MTYSRSFYTEANRLAWNEAQRVHQAHRGEMLARAFSRPGHSTLNATFTARLLALGLKGAAIAHLCCNNGIELISALNLGAARGVGFDIGDDAIEEARSLAALAKAPGEFVRTDVYDIPPSFDGAFDQVWFTIGGLCWLPDVPLILRRAAELLKPGGTLLIYDLHPFTMLLPAPGEPAFRDPYRLEYAYFGKEPLVDTTGIDYVGHTSYEGAPKYDFPHTLSEVIGGVLAAGLTVRGFEEFPQDISNLFGHLENDGRVPLSYFLQAAKPSAP